MNDKFCPEHSEVMRCLGALEQGQADVKEALSHISRKIDRIISNSQSSTVNAAVERTKSKILYWVIIMAASGLIIGFINLALREFSKE